MPGRGSGNIERLKFNDVHILSPLRRKDFAKSAKLFLKNLGVLRVKLRVLCGKNLKGWLALYPADAGNFVAFQVGDHDGFHLFGREDEGQGHGVYLDLGLQAGKQVRQHVPIP